MKTTGYHRELLKTAEKLVGNGKRKPRQSDLRRASSTAYYAIFHYLAYMSAHRLVGSRGKACPEVWERTYRSLTHTNAKKVCTQLPNGLSSCPDELIALGGVFLDSQKDREAADYTPSTKFMRSQVLDRIATVRRAIELFDTCSNQDKKNFAAALMFATRR